MTTIKYNIAVDDAGRGAISIFAGGETVTVQHDHPNFTRISEALVKGEDPGPFLSIARTVAALDERIEITPHAVYFDGEPIHNTLTSTIIRYNREGRDTANLVRFLERLMENPSRRSREQLFDWVNDRELVIDEEGCFIGWKGVRDDLRSKTSGFAVVDGEEMNGYIPNEVGAVISMPRSLVQDDPNVACSHGLHVGTYEYARGFGAVLLEVQVDPADVVSVPTDSNHQKLRCCRYKVLRVHGGETDEFDEEYEPEATWEDPGVEPLADLVPESFLGRLRRALGRK